MILSPAIPVALFGIVEAQRHREGASPIPCFMGLFKYYSGRPMRICLRKGIFLRMKEKICCSFFPVFDRIETVFSSEWMQLGAGERSRN
jgi:hypothetical protein